MELRFALQFKIEPMKKNILVFGLILGSILCVNMIFTVNAMCNNPEMQSHDLIGWAAMIVVFSLTYFGARNYRNKYLDGSISFGKAFKVAALIAVVASTMYVVVWLFYYHLFVPDFMDQYSAHVLHKEARAGADAAALQEKAEEMEGFKEMYKNPLLVVLITYMEVLPVGLLVALVSAFLLKSKKKDDLNVAQV